MSDLFVASVRKPILRSLQDSDDGGEDEEDAASAGNGREGGVRVESVRVDNDVSDDVVEVFDSSVRRRRDKRRDEILSRSKKRPRANREEPPLLERKDPEYFVERATVLRAREEANALKRLLEEQDEEERTIEEEIEEEKQARKDSGRGDVESMSVRVRIDGETFPVTFEKNQPLECLFSAVAEKLRILRSAVLLEWDGLPINPTESAESQGFEEDDLVDGKVAPGAARIGSEIVGPAANALNVNPPTPGPAAKIIKVKVFLPTKTKPARYTVRSSDKVKKIIDHIRSKSRYDCQISLRHDNREISPESSFECAGIGDGDILRMCSIPALIDLT